MNLESPMERLPFEVAIYREQSVPLYAGNPLIEALPPILTQEEAARQLTYRPEYCESARMAPEHVRMHMIESATTFNQPLSIHLELEQMISRMLRTGYLGKRNPLSLTWFRDLQTRVSGLDLNRERHKYICSYAHGFTMIGISGIGKTRAVERIFSLYPQVISHNNFGGAPFSKLQVTWLILQCPHDASTRYLCKQFFVEMDKLLGTNYERWYASGRVTVDDMIRSMARVAELHSLGMLAIDEIQVLSQGKSGGNEKMLNFFLQLVNEIGLPVVMIGTYQAYDLFAKNLRLARRSTGEGDLVWQRMEPDAEWDEFVGSLWEFQYLRKRVPLTDSLKHRLYDLSQGITDFAVKLYMFSQVRAITTASRPEDETLTEAIMASVSADSFRTVNPILARLEAMTQTR